MFYANKTKKKVGAAVPIKVNHHWMVNKKDGWKKEEKISGKEILFSQLGEQKIPNSQQNTHHIGTQHGHLAVLDKKGSFEKRKYCKEYQAKKLRQQNDWCTTTTTSTTYILFW